MPFRWNPRESLISATETARRTLIALPVAAAIGSAVALFLRSLDLATRTRWEYPSLLWLLPAAGFAIGWLYHRFGRSVEGGNSLIIERIHAADGRVPARMAPLVLLGTVITHLFGGSAGREGTAVQMGGSIAGAFGGWFHLGGEDLRFLLMSGIAAGFGAVFGTPVTGAIFAMEVLAVRRISISGLIPCLAAAVVGDLICTAWGIAHTRYHIAIVDAAANFHIDPLLLLKVMAAAVAFGMASVLFTEMSHGAKKLFSRMIPYPPLRPLLGGAVIIGLVYLLGTRDYLGLGVTSPDPRAVTIVSAFSGGGAAPWSWWWKILFTAITLGSGFKGGEMTPLFFIGACLGNRLAPLLGAPVDLLAGVGFVAVFAGAANTPLACTIMGMELFGPEYTVYIAAGCFVAWIFSGRSTIYRG